MLSCLSVCPNGWARILSSRSASQQSRSCLVRHHLLKVLGILIKVHSEIRRVGTTSQLKPAGFARLLVFGSRAQLPSQAWSHQLSSIHILCQYFTHDILNPFKHQGANARNTQL